MKDKMIQYYPCGECYSKNSIVVIILDEPDIFSYTIKKCIGCGYQHRDLKTLWEVENK